LTTANGPFGVAAGFKINYDRLFLDAAGLTAESGVYENCAIRPIPTISSMDMSKDVQPGPNPADGRQQFPTPVAAINSTRSIKDSERREACVTS